MSKIIALLIAVFILTTFFDKTKLIATNIPVFANVQHKVNIYYNNDGNDDKNKSCNNLEPQFNYKTQGLTVTFFDKSKGTYQEIVWDFGDGNISKEIHPVHTYLAEGTYKFTQTIISEEGCSKTFSGEVYVK